MRHIAVLCALFGCISSGQASADDTGIQTSLAAVGCYDGPIDGMSNLAVRTAVRCFQKGIGADPDGTLSEDEARRLHGMAIAGETVERQERYEPQQIRRSDLNGGTPRERIESNTRRSVGTDAPPLSFESETAPAPETPAGFDMARLKALVDRSRDQADGSVVGNKAYPEQRSTYMTILVSEGGEPAMAYSPRYFGNTGWDIGMSFSCGDGGKVDYTQMLFAGGDGHDIAPEARLSLRIFPYGGGETEIPVELIETLDDSRGLIRVHGTFDPKTPFFANLQPTTNFQVQLKENGRPVPFTSGTDFSAVATDIRPLFGHCAGEPPAQLAGAGSSNTRTPVTPASRRVSSYLPNDADILDALRREMDAKMQMIDAFASRCDVVGETQNPLDGLACLGTGFGAFNSESIKVDIRSVRIDECVKSEKGYAYCRYRVDGSMRGTGLMGDLAPFFNAAMSMNGFSYARYLHQEGQWHLDAVYDRCNWGDGSIHCEWTETR